MQASPKKLFLIFVFNCVFVSRLKKKSMKFVLFFKNTFNGREKIVSFLLNG